MSNIARDEDDATARLTAENRALRAELERARATLAAYDEEFTIERHARAATQRERDDLRESLASERDLNGSDEQDQPDESDDGRTAADIRAAAAADARLAGEVVEALLLKLDAAEASSTAHFAALLERRVTVAALTRKLDAVQASAATRDAQSAGEMNAMRRKLDAAEASAAALTAALVECRVAAADEHLHRMRAEQTEAPTALLDCSFASRRRASGLMPG